MINESIKASRALAQLVEAFCDSNQDIILVSLSTSDGFPIICSSKLGISNQADKFAAMSSTLSALSDSSAVQMNQGQCNITIVEATSGNILFVKTKYINISCVLTVVAKEQVMLAVARYKTKNLANDITKVLE